jgi:hypothetical protein
MQAENHRDHHQPPLQLLEHAIHHHRRAHQGGTCQHLLQGLDFRVVPGSKRQLKLGKASQASTWGAYSFSRRCLRSWRERQEQQQAVDCVRLYGEQLFWPLLLLRAGVEDELARWLWHAPLRGLCEQPQPFLLPRAWQPLLQQAWPLLLRGDDLPLQGVLSKHSVLEHIRC